MWHAGPVRLAPAGDLTPIRRALHRYVWDKPAAFQGPAVTRVRRGQVHVARLRGGSVARRPHPRNTALARTRVLEPRVGGPGRRGRPVPHPAESPWLWPVTVLATAVVVLVTTRAQNRDPRWQQRRSMQPPSRDHGLATLRRALWWIATIGVVSAVVSWGVLAQVQESTGGWRSAVVWPVASVSLLTSAVLAAIVRPAAPPGWTTWRCRRSRQSRRTEVLQAERSEYLTTARLLHDTVINTLTAIGRGVPEADLAALRLRCRQDLALMDRRHAGAGADPGLGHQRTGSRCRAGPDGPGGAGPQTACMRRRVPQPMIDRSKPPRSSRRGPARLAPTARRARSSAELIIEEQPGGIELVVRDTGRGYWRSATTEAGVQAR